jgi:peptidoglycan hydrolase-like amidase
MLEPGVIPEHEPVLRVGIVLPEDLKREIWIQIPAEREYYLSSGQDKTVLSVGAQLHFSIAEQQVAARPKNTKQELATQWHIYTEKTSVSIGRKSGIRVKEVVSGRGFHWQKLIDVFLPGQIEIRSDGNSLILINVVPLEEYLMCVATSEMGAACPSTLIESQTIVARSWMLANVEMKHRALGMDVCNDDCCQRYQGTNNLTPQSVAGAHNTCGQVLMHSGQICDARYSKSCGGVMETFENVWGGNSLPYMQPMPDAPAGFLDPLLPLDSEARVKAWIESVPKTFCSSHVIPENELKQYLGSVDEAGQYFRWQFHFSQSELTGLLKQKLNLEIDSIKAVVPCKRGYSGRLLKLRIDYLCGQEERSRVIADQYQIRKCLHPSFLYSSAFIVETEPAEAEIPEAFILKGAGWGHGAGYCQIGAAGMALLGYSAPAICRHYFPGSALVKIY